MININSTYILNTVSFTLIVKLTFIFLLLFLSIYLLYLEYTLIEKQVPGLAKAQEVLSNIQSRAKLIFNKGEFPNNTEKGSNINRVIRDVIFKYVPGAITYYTFAEKFTKNPESNSKFNRESLNTKDSTSGTSLNEQVFPDTLSNKSIKELTKIQYQKSMIEEDLRKSPMLNDIEKAKGNSLLAPQEMMEKAKSIEKYNVSINDHTNKLLEIKDLKLKQKEGTKLTEEENRLLGNETFHTLAPRLIEVKKEQLKTEVQNFNSKLYPEVANAFGAPDLSTSPNIDTEIKKSVIFSTEFNYNDFLNSLTLIELFAFGNLIFNQLILSYTISIVLILYGDFLIKRFD